MQKLISKIILFSIVIFVASCSTIFNGSLSNVDVVSSPTNAMIYVNGQKIGPTPALLKLRRGEVHVIEIKMDGHQPFRVVTQKRLTGWFWGNLITGGLVGMAVDLITGNAYDVEPIFINATLYKDTSVNKTYDIENINGIKVYDELGNDLGKIQFAWE